MTVQRIGILATRAADLSLVRGHIDALFAALPSEADWEFRYFRTLSRFNAALRDRTVTVGVLLHTDPRRPLPAVPSDVSVVVIRPSVDNQLQLQSIPGEIALHDLSPARLQQALRSAIQRRELDEEVRYLEQHDAITDLPRGAVFAAQIDAQLETGAAAQGVDGTDAADDVARPHLHCIALKGFCDLEATLGVATAERLLRLAAQRLKQRVNKRDLLARGDGAEFLVYGSQPTGAATALRRAKQFAVALSAPFELSESVAYITTTIGVARASRGLAAPALLQQARAAAEASALPGASGVQLFDAGMLRSSRRQQMTEALGYAIERNEFEVFYQPIVDLQTGAIAGAEALLRWHGHSVGAVSPGHFIPLAEESGAILSIGEWVLQHACREAVTWLDRFWQPVRLAVNVSTQQFRTRRLQEDLLRLLSELPLTPDQIELEVSERNYLELVRSHHGEFEALRDLGFRIVIDDFGTSYASLSYLKQFPVDVIKIDRSFIAPLPGTPGDAALVKAIIAMGKNLGLRVVGVGVETEAQLEFLRHAGCDEAQGFYLSHPVPGDEFISLLLRNAPVTASATATERALAN